MRGLAPRCRALVPFHRCGARWQFNAGFTFETCRRFVQLRCRASACVLLLLLELRGRFLLSGRLLHSPSQCILSCHLHARIVPLFLCHVRRCQAVAVERARSVWCRGQQRPQTRTVAASSGFVRWCPARGGHSRAVRACVHQQPYAVQMPARCRVVHRCAQVGRVAHICGGPSRQQHVKDLRATPECCQHCGCVVQVGRALRGCAGTDQPPRALGVACDGRED